MRSASGSLSRRNLLSGKDPPLFCFVATHPKLSMLAPHLCPADSHDVGLCLARPTQDEHSCKQELEKTGSSPLQCDGWNQVCFESAAQVKCPRPDPPELVSATQVWRRPRAGIGKSAILPDGTRWLGQDRSKAPAKLRHMKQTVSIIALYHVLAQCI